MVYVGPWKELIRLGYRANCPDIDYFRSYTKDATKGVLRVVKSRDVVLNTFSEELTAKIFDFLVRNNFDIGNKEHLVVLEKESKNLVSYDYYKHCPIGVYGFNPSNEELDNIFDHYEHFRLSETVVQILKELYDTKLVELREFQNNKRKEKVKAV